ncbi:hypothetical protein AGMMS49983_21670 [Clostridia bacterium]|nr:hypothetical protein AGMMS49983_21670 [Clostridia bacterium]
MAKTSVNRYTDKIYYAFTYYGIVQKTGIEVRCPVCNGLGHVKLDIGKITFQCTICGKKTLSDLYKYSYCVQEICSQCERHYRVDVDKANQNFKVLNVECPYCHHKQPGTVQKMKQKSYAYNWEPEKPGFDPYTNLPLYYQTVFDGKLIWALNREHLLYLIDYIEADIRETKEQTYYDEPPGTATQSDHLPKFMKLAKNRHAIVKLLRRLL